MSGPSAKVIADSISTYGKRLTTLEVRLWRPMAPEFNTHRAFSRNAPSSRAIPVTKTLESILGDPAGPISWLAEKPGMRGGEPLEGDDLVAAQEMWEKCKDSTLSIVQQYIEDHPDKEKRLHKSSINRLLEPFSWHTIICTASDFSNFFALRCHPDAQDDIRIPAELMREAMEASTPRLLHRGEWHLPYIEDDERNLQLSVLKKSSAARCARVSTLTHDTKKRDTFADLRLFDKLTSEVPPHESPLEHVATPCDCSHTAFHKGNFIGWDQYRHLRKYCS